MYTTSIRTATFLIYLFAIFQLPAASLESFKEKAAKFKKVMATIEAEGLSKERCYLKGKRIGLRKAKFNLYSVPREWMPIDIDFSKGGLCGISSVSSDIKDLQNKAGNLDFVVAGKNAMISWGNFDLTKPPVRICFDKHSHYNYTPIYAVKIKLQQSLPESIWKISFKQWSDDKIVSSKPVKVKGNDWQEVTIRSPHSLAPFTGLRIECETPGNQIKISKVELCMRAAKPAFRKTITLPAQVRWAKCSISTHGWYKLYVNGKLALDAPESYITREESIYNYELNPELFKKGKNVIAFTEPQFGRSFLLDGALLCKDGTYIRFDTDASWKCKQNITARDWSEVNYNDSDWENAVVYKENNFFKQPVNTYSKFYFNPSWKGRIMIKPVGRRDPIFGSKDNISLKVSVPFKTGKILRLSYKLYNEMGDYCHAEDKLIKSGMLELKRDGLDNSAIFNIPSGQLPHNVCYALELSLEENQKEIEKRRYEFAVCGRIKQPVVKNPKNWWDGMKLKLVKEIDPTRNFSPDEFISCIGKKPRSIERNSKVITTPLGKFRQTYDGGNSGGDTGEGCSFLSWRFQVENPGKPHVAIADYPDDTNRCQELRLTGIPPYDIRYGARQGAIEMGNDTVVLGIDNPLTHTIKQHHVLFFPSWKQCTVSVFSIGGSRGHWTSDFAARIGKIRIYEILNDVPKTRIFDAPGPPKWLFQQSEPGPRVIQMNCLSSPIAPILSLFLILSDAPNFYRNWMVTYINLIKRMNFAGENAYSNGIFMYDRVLYPSKYSFATALAYTYSGSLKDSGTLMAKMFEENNMGMFVGMEVYGLPGMPIKVTDADVANGADTLAQVGRDGRQLLTYKVKYALKIKSIVPNWLRPEVMKQFDTIISELLNLYGKEKAFKGIVLYVIPKAGWGLGYKAKGGDAFFASYDDYTISLFEKETGIEVQAPKTGAERFSKRYEWLRENVKKQWKNWRAKKVSGIYQRLRDRLKKARPDLKLIVHYGEMDGGLDITEADKNNLLYEHAEEQGFNLKALKDDPDIILTKGIMCNLAARRVLKGLSQGNFRAFAHSPAKTTAFADDGINGVAARYIWSEAQVFSPERGWAWTYSAPESWLFPGGDYFSDYLTNLFVRTNPTLIPIAIQDVLVWNGREVELARFAQAFRSVPAAKYTRLKGNGLDKNIWLQVCEYGNDIYGYVANTQWWNMNVEIKFAESLEIHDILNEETIHGGTWKLKLSPYRIRTFRIANAKGKKLSVFKSASAHIDSKDLEILKNKISNFDKKSKNNKELLQQGGKWVKAQEVLRECKTAMKTGDYSLAYEKLSLNPIVSEIDQLGWKEEGYKQKVFKIKKLNRKIKMDGSVSEWRGMSSTRILGAEHLVVSVNDIKWLGDADTSAIIYGGWDDENLYLALDVLDDKYLPVTGDKTQKGDSVEIYLDMNIAGDYGSAEYSSDDFHIKLSPPQKSQIPGLLISQGNKGRKKVISAEKVKVAGAQTTNGYHLELIIPWKVLNVEKVDAGTKVGFDIGLLDRDRESKGWEKGLMWSAPRFDCWKDPRILGRIELVSGYNDKEEACKLFKQGKYSEALQAVKQYVTEKKMNEAGNTYLALIKMGLKLSPGEKTEFAKAIRAAASDKEIPNKLRVKINYYSIDFLDAELKKKELCKVVMDSDANRWIKAPAYFQLSKLELKGEKPDLSKAFAYNVDAILTDKLKSSYYLLCLAKISIQENDYKAALGFATLSWWGFFNSGNKPWLKISAVTIKACLEKTADPDTVQQWEEWLRKGLYSSVPTPVKSKLIVFPKYWNEEVSRKLQNMPRTNTAEVIAYGEILYRLGRLKEAEQVFARCLNLKQTNRSKVKINKYFENCKKWQNAIFCK